MRWHEKSGVHGVYTAIAYEPAGFRSKDHTIISVATGLPPSNRGRKRVLRIFLSKRSTLGSLSIAGCATASSSSVPVSVSVSGLVASVSSTGATARRSSCVIFPDSFKRNCTTRGPVASRLNGGSARMPSMSGSGEGDSNSAARITGSSTGGPPSSMASSGCDAPSTLGSASSAGACDATLVSSEDLSAAF